VKTSSRADNEIKAGRYAATPSGNFTDYITNLIAKTLRLDPRKIDPEEDFEMYGLDSIVIGTLNSRLEQQFGKLPATLFFTYKSVRTLAEYFAENHKDKITLLTGHQPSSSKGNLRSAKTERSGFSPTDKPKKTTVTLP